MADVLGVGRTSVSILAHSLQQAGLITYKRGHIHVTKVDALESLACECYDTIRLRYQLLSEAKPSKLTQAKLEPESGGHVPR